jgi:multidrug resistance efflux pump
MNALQGMNGLMKERQQLDEAYKELEEQTNQLHIEQAEHEQSLTMNLFFNHEELKSQIAQWKQKYAFVSPYKGSVEMLGFWKEKSYVHVGEEIFAIVPEKNPLMAQVVIPSAGAGKVKVGQEVIVKLDDFPYLEYGAIKGKVTDVSMLSSTSSELALNEKLLTYQVNVELPEQLKTNYGSLLNFKHDMKGVAQIQVKKRKLIERLFDNLKYIMNE